MHTTPLSILEDINAADLRAVSTELLVETLWFANRTYRAGKPIITDDEYDNILLAELVRRDPTHPYLNTVEPEPVAGKTVKLPERMLSTQKAYTAKEIRDWYAKVTEAAKIAGKSDGEFSVKVMPKLDGYAAIDRDGVFATRGDGINGTDISHVRARGLDTSLAFGNYQVTNSGKGEIVVMTKYFEEHLSGKFENSRNVIAAVIKEGELDSDIAKAVREKAILFVPFTALPKYLLTDDLICDELLDGLWEGLVDSSYFDTDGLVFEVTDPHICDVMGSTNHHHRWQIAYKRNTEYHDCKVTGITWQTAKTGRITPVVNIEPTKISGVTVSNVTGHHWGNVFRRGINIDAVVKVCRSGQVIPHISEVVTKSERAFDIGSCPSCGLDTEIDGDNLLCVNTTYCPAQIENTVRYFFETIGNCDGFGPAIIEKIHDILRTNEVEFSVATLLVNAGVGFFTTAGIGSGVAKNLMSEVERCKATPVEDWRFLAAFSIPGIGKGGCEKILKHYTIEEAFEIDVADIVKIDGFAHKTAVVFVDSMDKIKEQFDYLYPQFNIVRTQKSSSVESPITGKTVVFTGTMVQGNRGDMEKQAKSLGATVGSSVSSKTHYLVCGDKVGQNKTAAAEKHGVTVLSEQQYLQLIA